MKRPIPGVNIKEYAREGSVAVFPGNDEIRVELNKCTLFASKSETLGICAALMDAGYKVWGSTFITDLLHIGAMRETHKRE